MRFFLGGGYASIRFVKFLVPGSDSEVDQDAKGILLK